MNKKDEQLYKTLVVGINILADRIKKLEDENELQQKLRNEAYEHLCKI